MPKLQPRVVVCVSLVTKDRQRRALKRAKQLYKSGRQFSKYLRDLIDRDTLTR